MIYVLVGIAILTTLYFYIRNRNRRPTNNDYDATWLVNAHKERQRELTSSTPFIRRVSSLFGREPKWDEIFEVLNPNGDNTVNELLLQFRGPHLFAPKVAVNILEICFNKLESEARPVNGEILLRTALEEGDRILKWHK